jgi:hypothetical protein
MAEVANAYITWQLCEMGDVLKDNLDEIYPIAPQPRVCSGFLILPINWRWAEFSNF